MRVLCSEKFEGLPSGLLRVNSVQKIHSFW